METTPPPNPSDRKPPADREDALAVVRRLRGAGHVAYFAGGCVRDLLLEREAKDYDVATDAPPERVRELFTNTQAVGQAFGVILVRHRRSQIEVATFRSDGAYLDGRRPSEVRFTTAEEDARRRDFTINGLFLDPLAVGSPQEQVIDYVGGREDLRRGVVRAIGDPERRLAEDYLRLLRAVRFAARLGFTMDPATAAAVRRHAPRLAQIAPERVGEELRVMLPPPTRVDAWRLLNELELAPVLFRFLEAPVGEPDESRRWDGFFPKLAPGRAVPFGEALAVAALQYAWWALPKGRDIRTLLERPAVLHMVQAMRRALKISNEESDEMQGTLEGLAPLLADAPPGVATIKRFLSRPTADGSRGLLEAIAGELNAERVAFLRRSFEELKGTETAPTPLITGDDLMAAGLKPGPVFKRVLDAVYDAQLEGRVGSRDEAMALGMELARQK
jgi:poly(A) polymerase